MHFAPVIPLVESDPRIIAVYALGSAVRDELRPDSDIDLGLLSAMNLVYLRQAVLAGQCIYQRPFSPAALMVANGLGLYAHFHDERREVLNAYTAR